MKVYEIISEQTAHESKGIVSMIGQGAQAVAGLFKGGKAEFIKDAGQEAMNIARKTGKSFDQAAENLFAKKQKEVANYAKKYKVSPEEAARQLDVHPIYLKPPAGIAKEVADEAKEAKGLETLAKVGVKGKWDLLGKTIEGTVTAWGLYELVKPLLEFREQMVNAQSQVDSGKWTQENYQAALNQQTAILIAKMAALMVSGGIFNLLASPLRGPLMKKIPGLATVLIGGQNAILTWVNNESNSSAIAAFVANEIPGMADLVGGALSPFMKPLLKYSFAGSGTPSGATPSSGAAAPAGTTSGTNTNTSGTTAQQDIGSTSSTPAAGSSATGDIDPKTGKTKMGRKMWSVDPLEVNNYDITGWIQKPGDPHSIVDPKNPANFLPKPDTYTWQPN